MTLAVRSTPLIKLRSIEKPRLDTWLRKSQSEKTRKKYEDGLTVFLLFAGKSPYEITAADIQSYCDHLKTTKRKNTTIATKLAILRSYFNHLREYGDIQINPASTDFIRPPRLPRHSGKRALNPSEVRYIIGAPDRNTVLGARDHAILLTLARTAMRVSEMLALKESSFIWENNAWKAIITLKGGEEYPVPIPMEVRKAIYAYVHLDTFRREVQHSDGDEAFIFQPTQNYRTLQFNKALSPQQVDNIINKWAQYMGITAEGARISAHTFRRTAATQAFRQGRSITEVQNMLGHKEVKSTLRYDCDQDQLKNNAINFLNYEKDDIVYDRER